MGIESLTDQQLAEAIQLVETSTSFSEAGRKAGLSHAGMRYRYHRAIAVRDGLPMPAPNRAKSGRHQGYDNPWANIAASIITIAVYDMRSGRPCDPRWCIQDGGEHGPAHRCAEHALKFLRSEDAQLYLDLLGIEDPDDALRRLGVY